MKNININEVVLSKDIINERVEFFKRNMASNNKIPNFKVVYRDILLNSIISYISDIISLSESTHIS